MLTAILILIGSIFACIAVGYEGKVQKNKNDK